MFSADGFRILSRLGWPSHSFCAIQIKPVEHKDFGRYQFRLKVKNIRKIIIRNRYLRYQSTTTTTSNTKISIFSPKNIFNILAEANCGEFTTSDMEGPFFLPEAPNRYELAPRSELSDPDQFALLRGVVRDRRSDMQTMFGDVYRCFADKWKV